MQLVLSRFSVDNPIAQPLQSCVPGIQTQTMDAWPRCQCNGISTAGTMQFPVLKYGQPRSFEQTHCTLPHRQQRVHMSSACPNAGGCGWAPGVCVSALPGQRARQQASHFVLPHPPQHGLHAPAVCAPAAAPQPAHLQRHCRGAAGAPAFSKACWSSSRSSSTCHGMA